MDSARKNKLQEKLQLLQIKLNAQNRIKQEFIPWLSLCDVLVNNSITYDIQFVAVVKEVEKEYWIHAIEHLPELYSITSKHLLIGDSNPVHEQVIQHFPNHYPLRYVPNIPVVLSCKDDMFKAMQFCKTLLPITDKVLFFHEHFSPVIELKLDALCTYANELIQPLDNAFICSPNFDWLLFKSLEDEWRFGIKSFQR